MRATSNSVQASLKIISFLAGVIERISIPGATMTSESEPQTTVARLCHFARTNLLAEGKEFDEHSPLAEAGIDSFGLFELLLFSERTFGVNLPESHWTHENLRTLASLGRCIAELAKGNSTPEHRL
jgi:acyl carrier protein